MSLRKLITCEEQSRSQPQKRLCKLLGSSVDTTVVLRQFMSADMLRCNGAFFKAMTNSHQISQLPNGNF